MEQHPARLSDEEWSTFVSLIKRFAATELDQWVAYRLDTPNQRIYITIANDPGVGSGDDAYIPMEGFAGDLVAELQHSDMSLASAYTWVHQRVGPYTRRTFAAQVQALVDAGVIRLMHGAHRVQQIPDDWFANVETVETDQYTLQLDRP